MLAAAYSERMEAYARRVGRVGEMKLVVMSMDSIHIAIQTPANHDTLKRTFSSKIGGNGVGSTPWPALTACHSGLAAWEHPSPRPIQMSAKPGWLCT